MHEELGREAARLRLGARGRDGRLHGVHADHLEATGGEGERVLAGAAARVQHRPRTSPSAASRSNAGCARPMSQGGVPLYASSNLLALTAAHLPGESPSLSLFHRANRPGLRPPRDAFASIGSPSKEPDMTDYRARSMWLDGIPGELTPRPSLPGATDVDVAIVGAGFTGLWTAYYLKKADPHLRVAVLEREIAGFGASGRNGGWCHTTFPGSRGAGGEDARRQAVIDQQRALHRTVYEIARVVEEEGIDARFHLGGQLDLALTPVQLLRLRESGRVRALLGLRRGRLPGARRRGDARAHQGGRVPRRRLHAARRRRRPGPPRARARRRRRGAGGAHLRAHPRHPPRAARRRHGARRRARRHRRARHRGVHARAARLRARRWCRSTR